MRDRLKIVIIGGDAAGLSAGAQIKRLSPETEVTVLERKNYISYSNCSIPYILSGKISSMQDIIHMTPEVYTATRGPEVIIAAEVIKINSSQKIVLFKKGGNVEKIHYDRLIIASGASYAEASYSLPSFVPVPEQFFNAKKMIDDGGIKKALVIGGGFAGLETALELQEAGVGAVILEGERILPGYSDDLRTDTLAYLSDRNIEIYENTLFHGVSQDGKARTSKGVVECDALFVCTGVLPNTDFIDIAKVKNGAIKVNYRMQTSDEHIFAAGDCASYINTQTGLNEYRPMGTYANRAGVIAGESALGFASRGLKVFGSQVLKLGEFQIGRTGITRSSEEIISEKYTSHKASALDAIAGEVNVRLFSSRKGIIKGCEFWGHGDALRRIYLLAALLETPLSSLIDADLPYSPLLSNVKDVIQVAALRLNSKIAGI